MSSRDVKSSKLGSVDSRKHIARGETHWVTIDKGVSLGYRRLKPGKAGPWIVRSTVGKHKQKSFGRADDYEPANEAARIYDYHTACRVARKVARGDDTGGDDVRASGLVITVRQALDRYKLFLEGRGKDPRNAIQARSHLARAILDKPISLLSKAELAGHLEALLARGLTAASVNRILCPLKAALEREARLDDRVTNQSAWRVGLKKIEAARRSRNLQVQTPAGVARIVAGAYEESFEFGLLVEMAATTGARYSQLARIKVDGLLRGVRSFVMVPSSAKGRGVKKERCIKVPVPPALAGKLVAAAGDRPGHAPLLLKPVSQYGRRVKAIWLKGHEQVSFQNVAKRLDLYHVDEDGRRRLNTMYCLRHSSITNQLLAGTPEAVIARMHDTSVEEIHATYARYISDHGEKLFSAGQIDFGGMIDLPVAA